MKLSFTILLFITSLKVFTQEIKWTRAIGGNDYEDSRSIIMDETGSSYMIGWFRGTMDLNPGEEIANITARLGYDSYILKLDRDGKFLWGFNLEGNGNLNFYDMVMDSDGNIYITGDFTKTIDFDPGPEQYNLTADQGNTFILKLNSDGKFLQAVKFALHYNRAYAIDIDNLGNIYTTGYFREETDFDPGPNEFILQPIGSPQAADVFICKLDKNFNFQWVKSYGGYDYSQGTEVKTDSNGNVYFAGIFLGTIDFDPESGTLDITSKGRGDFFVTKFNQDGVQEWVQTFGSSNENDEVTSIEIDSNNNIYLAGFFSGTIDFDPAESVSNLSPVNENNNFLLKLDTYGKFEWVINAVGRSISIGPNNEIYLAGKFKQEFDFDSSEANANFLSNGEYDIAVSKYNSDGNYLWAITFGSEGNDYGYNIDTNKSGDVIVNGAFKGLVYFSETESLESEGESNDIFVYKFNDKLPEDEDNENDEDQDEHEELGNLKIKIAPNPTYDFVNILNELETIKSVIVIDNNGKIVYSKDNINLNNFSFNLDKASGIYFIKIQTGKEIKTLKLIKK